MADKGWQKAVLLGLTLGIVLSAVFTVAFHASKKWDMQDRFTVAAAISALGGLAPEVDCDGLSDTALWGIQRDEDGEHVTVTAPETCGDVTLKMIRQGPEYAPYHITIDGEDAFQVSEDWARQWFFTK